jgi:hypothetical protein
MTNKKYINNVLSKQQYAEMKRLKKENKKHKGVKNK